MSERTFKNWFSCVSLDKKYQDIVKRGECSKEEIQDFVGSGIDGYWSI